VKIIHKFIKYFLKHESLARWHFEKFPNQENLNGN